MIDFTVSEGGWTMKSKALIASSNLFMNREIHDDDGKELKIKIKMGTQMVNQPPHPSLPLPSHVLEVIRDDRFQIDCAALQQSNGFGIHMCVAENGFSAQLSHLHVAHVELEGVGRAAYKDYGSPRACKLRRAMEKRKGVRGKLDKAKNMQHGRHPAMLRTAT